MCIVCEFRWKPQIKKISVFKSSELSSPENSFRRIWEQRPHACALSSCARPAIRHRAVTTASVERPADVLGEQKRTSQESTRPWPSLSVQLAHSCNKANSTSWMTPSSCGSLKAPSCTIHQAAGQLWADCLLVMNHPWPSKRRPVNMYKVFRLDVSLTRSSHFSLTQDAHYEAGTAPGTENSSGEEPNKNPLS